MKKEMTEIVIMQRINIKTKSNSETFRFTHAEQSLKNTTCTYSTVCRAQDNIM